MKLFKLTKKQAIRDIIILVLLLLIGWGVLCFYAARHWKPAEITVKTRQMPENPYIVPAGDTQETRILPPEGYTRIPAAEDSFLHFMRKQPLYPDGSDIYMYDGTSESGVMAAAVYQIPLGNEGYQQCADSIIRLWSTYFRETGQTEKLMFHLTNGMECGYDTFRKGMRVLAVLDWAAWMPLALPAEDSDQLFNDWLMTVMRYAGTISLYAESQTISAKDAHAGDIICHPDSPGHVVVIVDEAENAAGERCFLLAQGWIPAQSCHIFYNQQENPWITEEMLSQPLIQTAPCTFQADELRRWGEGFPNAADKGES